MSGFGSVGQIEAGVLSVGYVDDGPAVLLLHGWPYFIHSYVDVVPVLAAAGHRVIVPYLRGYGSTRFLSNDTFRNGEQAALAVDAIALLDALEIASKFSGEYSHRTIARGVGHNLPQEAPEAFAHAVLEVGRVRV